MNFRNLLLFCICVLYSSAANAGLDLKTSLASNVTLDVTVNTDFAQVEANDQKIILTRFSLFFPEKRVFLLEKADVFDFPLQEGNKYTYTFRTIRE